MYETERRHTDGAFSREVFGVALAVVTGDERAQMEAYELAIAVSPGPLAALGRAHRVERGGRRVERWCAQGPALGTVTPVAFTRDC